MRANLRLFLLGGLLVTVALALVVSGFASSSPDGLEKVASDQGFATTAKDQPAAGGPLADYQVTGVDDRRLGTGLSGVIGVLLTFGLGLVLFALLRAWRPGDRDRDRDEEAEPTRAP